MVPKKTCGGARTGMSIEDAISMARTLLMSLAERAIIEQLLMFVLILKLLSSSLRHCL